MELTKERKKALRTKALNEAIDNAPVKILIPINVAYFILFIFCIIIGIEETVHYVMGLIFVLLLIPFITIIVCYIGKYKELKKEEEERIARANYLDGCFCNGDIWVTPKYHKEYSEFFENLSDLCEIKYYASFKKETEKIKICITIDSDTVIEFEEIEKADFLDFYQIAKNKL